MRQIVKTAFIVGSPRSGTTILGDTLDSLPNVGQWYEPYFILDRYFRDRENDIRTGEDATPEVIDYTRKQFQNFGQAKNINLIVDKSPRSSLKIPFLVKIFPDAKFVHILRDGRDTTHSLYREWVKRRMIVHHDNLFKRVTKKMLTLNKMLSRQPFLKHRIQALNYELGGLMNFKQSTHLNRTRWEGKVGFGPRFDRWQEEFDDSDFIAFNAKQWLACVQQIHRDQSCIPAGNYLEVRYEDFCQAPLLTIKKITDFLEVEFDQLDLSNIMPRNFGKWSSMLSVEQLRKIGPVLGDELIKLGYAKDYSWHQ